MIFLFIKSFLLFFMIVAIFLFLMGLNKDLK
jgi:uncharacterized protein YqhQ